MEHVNAFNQLVTDLARLDVKIDDEDKALLLISLPPSYEHLVITSTHGKTTVNNEEVTAALLGHELRKQKNATEESTQGLELAVKGYQTRKGQEAEKKKKKKVQCYRCKDWGHIKRECPELKGGASANAATHGDDSDNSSDVLVVSNRRPTKLKRGCLIQLALFMRHPTGSGSLRTSLVSLV